ncbi:hypothetical protein TVAG_429780 [Trichomonas vaginalis G3]|uniref:Bromo domain-containing protein n=1 Tax=Trichomonas vaginalis (strain ATCC PRA-98 / G3) TaxID=412133 RepID=A2FKN8_TRIV3|nr:bromodomain family [Trichomonas vaginalis G3]EAX94536.1 hypothetical protein TVAG_429780 [Trichomonas vaginalis G3]KAI5534852.1 bromodomain family [Trichomonas vaginalis G3]|eukprot:XP_001307466.1 hypothetical protein [Trichomonas vaginalis G3]
MKCAEVKICLEVLDNLMKRPILKLFLPRQTHSNENYIDENKLTFDKIKDKLFCLEYNHVNDFVNDVHAIFESYKEIAKDLFRELSLSDLETEFNEEMKEKFVIDNNTSFDAKCSKLVTLLKNPPDNFIQIAQRIHDKDYKPIYQTISFDKLEDLSLSIKNCENPRITKGVISIIRAFQEFDEFTQLQDFHIKMNDLPVQCLHLLNNYVQEQFKVEGIPYPLRSIS